MHLAPAHMPVISLSLSLSTAHPQSFRRLPADAALGFPYGKASYNVKLRALRAGFLPGSSLERCVDLDTHQQGFDGGPASRCRGFQPKVCRRG